MKYDWAEISLATRAQVLLNWDNLDFSKEAFELVDIYQKNNKKNLDWFYDAHNKILVKSAEKTNEKYNFSFWNKERQDIKKIISEAKKIILGCFDVENSKIYRLEIKSGDICKKLENNQYTLTIDMSIKKFEEASEINIEEKYFKSWEVLSRAVKLATYNRPKGFDGEKEFIAWYTKKDKICCYCGVKEEDLEEYFKSDEGNPQTKNAVKRGRGMHLEIERIKTANGENEYTKENCDLACYICNNAKSDFLSAKDFKPIAKGINEFWKKHLGNKGDKVIFPEKSEIWKIDFNTKMESNTKSK